MSVQSAIVTTLLALAVLVELLAVLGLATMRTTMQRLHFIAPATCVGPVLAALAVAIAPHRSQSEAGKGLVIALVLLLFSGVLSHETGLTAASREGDS